MSDRYKDVYSARRDENDQAIDHCHRVIRRLGMPFELSFPSLIS